MLCCRRRLRFASIRSPGFCWLPQAAPGCSCRLVRHRAAGGRRRGGVGALPLLCTLQRGAPPWLSPWLPFLAQGGRAQKSLWLTTRIAVPGLAIAVSADLAPLLGVWLAKPCDDFRLRCRVLAGRTRRGFFVYIFPLASSFRGELTCSSSLATTVLDYSAGVDAKTAGKAIESGSL